MDFGNGCGMIIHILIQAEDPSYQGNRWIEFCRMSEPNVWLLALMNEYLKSFSQVKCPLYCDDQVVSSNIWSRKA